MVLLWDGTLEYDAYVCRNGKFDLLEVNVQADVPASEWVRVIISDGSSEYFAHVWSDSDKKLRSKNAFDVNNYLTYLNRSNKMPVYKTGGGHNLALCALALSWNKLDYYITI